jgi:hypothetical protein
MGQALPTEFYNLLSGGINPWFGVNQALDDLTSLFIRLPITDYLINVGVFIYTVFYFNANDIFRALMIGSLNRLTL